MKLLKTIVRKIQTVIKEPKWLLIRPLLFVSPLIEDTVYLRMLFYLRTGYKLNIKNPRTFNEKLQWIKINYRNPIMSVMADKFEAKKYIEEKVGNEHVIKNYGVWDSFEDIDFSKLPKEFVLKTTHDSGGVVICKDKNSLDKNKAKNLLNKHLKTKNYYITREWPYMNIKPRIIAEKLLMDTLKDDLWDYKFYCFNGEPKIMYISMGRQTNHIPFYFFDMDFELLDLMRPGHEHNYERIEKPKSWNLMIEMAKKLSKNLPHVRVDFYDVNDKIFLGELTFFQGGGMMPFTPEKWDNILGDMIDINNIII